MKKCRLGFQHLPQDPGNLNALKTMFDPHITKVFLFLFNRIKSFEFAEKGFKFEIPRILTLSDCAFRILFTKYDHFSAKSKSYYPRRKKKEGLCFCNDEDFLQVQ